MANGDFIGNKFTPISDETERIGKEVVDAAIEVHRHLGPGLLESIYERALVHELHLRKISTQTQVPIIVTYKDLQLPGQRLDLVVGSQVVVELKAIDMILPIHERQLVSYLKSTKLRLGFLINFNTNMLKDGLRRIVN
ncbi:MAG: GxxExxY protein [Phycisphaerae bacterium]|nr:GxxExxY protein [Phycisphaerae bacterium]